MAHAALALSLAVCSTSKSASTEGAVGPDAGVAPDASHLDDASADTTMDAGVSLLASRPYQMLVPTSYDAGTAAPVVIMLHGYGASGSLMESSYFRLSPSAEANGFLYAYPDGSLDSKGYRFWNATDACCNFDQTAVDDVAYLDAVLDDIESKYNVDTKRVFLVGHSNGAFMAHRMACDRARRIAAIVSVAGAQWNDPSRCVPEEAVSVSEMHGDLDGTAQDTTTQYGVLFDGGMIYTTSYPSALDTVGTWATKDACAGTLKDTTQTLDLIPSIAGSETSVFAYDGCPRGVSVELWKMLGGHHQDSLDTTAFGAAMWAFMQAHAKL